MRWAQDWLFALAISLSCNMQDIIYLVFRLLDFYVSPSSDFRGFYGHLSYEINLFFIFYHRQRYACVTCHCDDLIYKLKIFYFTYSFFLICLHTNTDYNTPTHRQTQSNLDISFPLKPRMNCSSSCLVIYLSPLVVLFWGPASLMMCYYLIKWCFWLQ